MVLHMLEHHGSQFLKKKKKKILNVAYSGWVDLVNILG